MKLCQIALLGEKKCHACPEQTPDIASFDSAGWSDIGYRAITAAGHCAERQFAGQDQTG